jgi:aminopeptidase N
MTSLATNLLGTLLLSIILFTAFDARGAPFRKSMRIWVHVNVYDLGIDLDAETTEAHLPPNPKRNLTQLEAETRFAQIEPGSVHYDVSLYLKKGPIFTGEVWMRFKTQKTTDVFFDYVGIDYQVLSINKQSTSDEKFDRKDGIVTIPHDMLDLPGQENLVRIRFENNYSNDGLGLHSNTDVDGAQYLWSQGEMAWANRVFPCFDQPDIKAPMKLTVKTHYDWVAISNEPLLRKVEGGEFITWTFQETKPLPPYLFHVTAGEYQSIQASEKFVYNGITQTLYCKKTLFEFAKKQADMIFEGVMTSIKGFEAIYRFSYPFSKADTIFVPDFYYTAMENPGAVIYAEKLLYRHENPSVTEISFRNYVINHEYAHMWFGNTVTLKWWSDIWLNEAFADYAAILNSADQYEQGVLSFKIDNPWVRVISSYAKAMQDDQLSSTHPIANVCKDIGDAEANFDALTYFKGNATLKQLFFVIGRKNFSQAMQQYFEKLNFKNATLDDLLGTFVDQICNFFPVK